MWWVDASTNPVEVERQFVYTELHKQIALDENSEYGFSHDSELRVVLPKQRHNTSAPQSGNEITPFTQTQRCTLLMNHRGQKLMLVTSGKVNMILGKQPNQQKKPYKNTL